MRQGKVSAAVYDRCIRHPLRRAGMAPEQRQGASAAWTGQSAGVSIRSIGGRLDPRPEMAVTEALLRLYTGRERCRETERRISLQFLLCRTTPEEQLREWMQRLIRYCQGNGLQIGEAQAWVSDAVCRDVLSVCARECSQETRPLMGSLAPGMALYMAGDTGAAGTSILARALETRLRERFPAMLLEQAKAMEEQALRLPFAFPEGCIPVWPVSDGGIFAALWEMGEHWNTGMDIDLRAVPVRQETIEICDYLELHPYQLYTCGAALFVLPQGADAEAALRQLAQRGVPAARIGTITEGKARMLHSGEDTRCLEKPAPDALTLADIFV